MEFEASPFTEFPSTWSSENTHPISEYIDDRTEQAHNMKGFDRSIMIFVTHCISFLSMDMWMMNIVSTRNHSALFKKTRK